MVYKYHQFIREELGPEDSSYWYDDQNPALAKRIRNLRRGKPIIPYTLEIECNSYWGNFEREFVAYSMGILDDVQMRIKHSEKELIMFWNEVFNYRPLTFEEALRNYELLKDYLFETWTTGRSLHSIRLTGMSCTRKSETYYVSSWQSLLINIGKVLSFLV